MDQVVSLVASNSALAALLALIAWVVTGIWRNPQLAHALWLLVLVKLVTPALATVPLPNPWNSLSIRRRDSTELQSGAIDQERRAGVASWEPAADGRSLNTDSAVIHGDDGIAERTDLGNKIPSRGPSTSETDSTKPAPLNAAFSASESVTSAVPIRINTGDPDGDQDSRSWGRPEGSVARNRELARINTNSVLHVLALVWLSGVVLQTSRLLRGCRRFRQLLATSESADEILLTNARSFAARMKVSRRPIIRVVDAKIPPLIWSLGWQPIVLLPRSLMRELNASQRQSVLVHELAHIRRYDDLLR